MIKINTNKILIFAVLMAVFSPLFVVLATYFIKPSFYEYSLSYIEIPSDENKNEVPLAMVFCFEVPNDLELEGDLQDYLVALTKDDLKVILASSETGIDKVEYKTTESCSAGYSVKIKADDVEKGYKLYKKGEL